MKRLINNIMMTINMAMAVFIANVDPLFGTIFFTWNVALWFHSIAWMRGFNKATKVIDSRVEAFHRVIKRYLKGEIKVINEQVLEEELALNKYYK